MLRHLAVIITLLCLGAADARPPTPWPLKRFVAWQADWGARTIATDGLTISIEPKQCGPNEPEACTPDSRYLVATVHRDGMSRSP